MFDFDVRSGRENDPADKAALTAILVDLSRGSPLRDEFSECVDQIPRRPPLVVGPSTLTRTALGLMAERPSGAVLVEAHGVLLGMLTPLDVVQRMLDSRTPLTDLPVPRIMESSPQTLLESDSIGYAIRKLWTLSGRPMPIVQPSGALIGVLETEDVLTWLCGRIGGAGLTPPQPGSRDGTAEGNLKMLSADNWDRDDVPRMVHKTL